MYHCMLYQYYNSHTHTHKAVLSVQAIFTTESFNTSLTSVQLTVFKKKYISKYRYGLRSQNHLPFCNNHEESRDLHGLHSHNHLPFCNNHEERRTLHGLHSHNHLPFCNNHEERRNLGMLAFTVKSSGNVFWIATFLYDQWNDVHKKHISKYTHRLHLHSHLLFCNTCQETGRLEIQKQQLVQCYTPWKITSLQCCTLAQFF